MDDLSHIRNFAILAHIDHGKSTLADRFLEFTKTVEARKMKAQLLDQMDLERERGITIKMQPVRMVYHLDGIEYALNLIDTPGHIDFSYEVSRALAAVEGIILLVDATQGVQAQTLTNLHIAENLGKTIIPVLNKIDMKEARVEEVRNEVHELLSGIIKADDILTVSGKTGEGVEVLLGEIIKKLPPPQAKNNDPKVFQALIFDSLYENHKGAVAFVRVFAGRVRKGDKAFLTATGAPFDVKEVGIFTPAFVPADVLSAGDVGYIVTGIKNPGNVHIGDTIVLASGVRPPALSGYRTPRPMIWASFYPESEEDFDSLKDALERLILNDAALTYEVESSPVMGRSFKCGFLGMLHLEIVIERLRREFGVSVVAASPTVAYEIVFRNGEVETITSPAKFPERDKIAEVREPWFLVEIIVPSDYLGDVLRLVEAHEGMVTTTETFGHGTGAGGRLRLLCEIPLREVVADFFDKLKSVSSGYASMNYEEMGFRAADVDRLDILVAEDLVPPFSRVVSRKKLNTIARDTVTSLKEILPRQLFQVKIQATAGGRIIASETLSALKKDVTGYLYGGDRSRKMKLWKKQKEGKKRLKAHGKMNIPPEVFLKMVKK